MSVPAQVEELIPSLRLSAHVATSVDGRPHVAPVWYVYDDGVLPFVAIGGLERMTHSGRGRFTRP